MLCFLIEFRQIDKLLLLLLLFFCSLCFFFTFLTLAFRLLCAEKGIKEKGEKTEQEWQLIEPGCPYAKVHAYERNTTAKTIRRKSLAEFPEGVIVRKKGALHDR